MKLRRLTIQGYKSFAARTEFVFDGGVTAIVGPNGSGKSNIADALRWVLGEQSYGLLRSKRTTDLIFAGSDGRGRVGMAEATVVLDNSDGQLPVEYQEVSITRRAYRSGENEYYINGSRVRLRDVSELLSQGGLNRLTYAVIGQGMIDNALSWSPTERRRLFEEAAGITIYQGKREDALRRLDEASTNVLRVHDIMTELEPQLGRLATQAEQATRYSQVEGELRRLQTLYYSIRLRDAVATAESERQRADYLQLRLEQQLAELDEYEAASAAMDERVKAEAAEVESRRREGERLSGALASAERQVAVLTEREAGTTQRLAELRQELKLVEAEAVEAAAEGEEAGKDVSRLEAALAELSSGSRLLQELVSARRGERQQQEQRLRQLRQDLSSTISRATESSSRVQAATKRRQELAKQIEDTEAQLAALQQDLEQRRQAVTEAQDRLRAGAAAVEAAQSDLTDRRRAESAAAQALQQQRQRLTATEEEEQRLRTRASMLDRLLQESLFPGVRSVLDLAAQEGDSGGILGAVSALLHVPAEYEDAIEAALGSRLQQVVVRRWADAERAIAHLKERRAGRVTFLPLETIRPPSPVSPSRQAGVIGLAADLVGVEPGLEKVLQYLLNRVVIVQDLPAARALLRNLNGSYTIATLDGEITQSSGSVTGGSERGNRNAVLERERERRDLPAAIESAREGRQQALLDAKAAQEAARAAEAAAATAAEVMRRAQAAAEREQRQEAHIRLELQQAQDRHQWCQQRLVSLRAESDGAARNATAASGIGSECEARAEVLREQVRQIESVLLDADNEAEVRLRAQQAKTEAAQQQLALHRGMLASARQRLERLQHRNQERMAQGKSLAETLEGVRSEKGDAEAARAQYHAALAQLRAAVEPAITELERLEQQRSLLQREERVRRQWHIEFGHNVSEAARAADRAQDAVSTIEAAIERDLGADMVSPLRAGLATTEVVPPLHELETGVNDLRRRARHMGQVNPNAPREHAEMLERYSFLSTQAVDLEEATASLRQVIGELEQTMEKRFRATFTAVARRFGTYFEELFAGGGAQLQLTNPDDLTGTGIEITVRPPGKRSQDLAALSGGERALTSTALLFALLEASSTPFCLIDEVDAMLDEANVLRFRRVMQSLAQRTQFIVISHNRSTIESASIIYGITMGDDGTSHVLSLRLGDGHEPAVSAN
ncbi:MAG: chromosome segregation protein SMC [Anaerolineae bacterium]